MCSDWASGQSSASLEPEKRCTGLKIGPMLSLFLKQDSCPQRSESVDTLMGFALSRAPVKMPFLEKAPKICQQVMLILLSLSSCKEPLDVLNNRNKIRLVYCFCLRRQEKSKAEQWGGWWMRRTVERGGVPQSCCSAVEGQWGRQASRSAAVKWAWWPPHMGPSLSFWDSPLIFSYTLAPAEEGEWSWARGVFYECPTDLSTSSLECSSAYVWGFSLGWHPVHEL